MEEAKKKKREGEKKTEKLNPDPGRSSSAGGEVG